jgi:mono/diheme cytochrome c family protein
MKQGQTTRAHPTRRTASAALALALQALVTGAAAAPPSDKAAIERGRYVVRIAGCNDCHTPGYAAANGKVEERLWLTGDSLGWRGPWGTTYPINLRLYLAGLTQQQWLDRVKSMQPRPPMPFYNVQAMTVQDQKAIYQFIKSLGPAGQNAPAWVPPDKVPPQPFVQMPG